MDSVLCALPTFYMCNIKVQKMVIKAGHSILLWKDKWDGNVLLENKLERLFSFAWDQDVSVQQVLQMDDLAYLFFLSLSEQAFEEFQEL